MWPLGMTVFRDTEVAKTWASSALQVAGILQITMRLMYGQLMTLARAADEAPPDGSVVEPWYEGQSGDRPRIFVPHDAVSQLEGFRVYIDRVIESAAEVTRAARKLEIHDGLHRRRGRSEAIAFAVVIFISGVAAPLLWDGVPRWVCAGVPVAAYCAAAYRALDGPIPARLLAFGRRIRSGRPPESPYPEAPPAANGMWGAPTGEFMEDQSPPGAPQT
jgi:hypothetical protein